MEKTRIAESIQIGNKTVSDDAVFVVAEMSANHLKDYQRACRIIREAAEAGADAVKLQTYTADTLTLNCDKERFVEHGNLWEGTPSYRLYEEASTPWEWHPGLMEEAKKYGMELFSSPFDPTAVAFMQECGMPACKIASYEITDIPLIRLCARTGRPVIIATGVATREDIEKAVEACLAEGNGQIVLLKCVSAYPTPYEACNLRMMTWLKETYHCITGISDHTMGGAVPVASVALGGRMIEKHLTLRRADGGPDAGFSMEPEEFARMVEDVRHAHAALGQKEYDLTAFQKQRRDAGARSLFVTKDIRRGEVFTEENIRSIRPGGGLPPVMIDQVLGKTAIRDLETGDPLTKDDVEGLT